MVHLFDSLVRTIPDGVALSNIKQEGEVLTLEGRAQSNARVSEYMRNLESSGWMTKPDLAIIEAKAEDAKALSGGISSSLPYMFNLQVRLANPNAPEGKDGQVLEGAALSEASPVEAPATPAAPADGKTPAGAPAPASQPAAPATTPAAPSTPAATPANSPGNAS